MTGPSQGSSSQSSPNADLDFCYLTTRGRKTGQPHQIELWFGLQGACLYLLANSVEADWVRNLGADPQVNVRVGDATYAASGRLVLDPAEDARARDLLFDKYEPRYSGDLSEWKQTSAVVAVDLPGGFAAAES
ncbi:MAG: nitroreductase/quinone reductase family protein [Actinomycetota bacterium]